MEKTIAVAQEHPMGCGVACVAFVLGISYRAALRRFDHPEHAATRGYYCPEICKALGGHRWKKHSQRDQSLIKEGTIVFVGKCERYPQGHFLVRTRGGWMNPWINFPHIVPAKAGIVRTLPGRVGWIIYA